MAHLEPLIVRLSLGALPRPMAHVLRHLARCERCREALGPGLDGEEASRPEASPASARYDEAFRRLEQSTAGATRAHAEKRARACRLLDSLLGEPAVRWGVIAAAPGYCSAVLAAVSLDRAEGALSSDPGLAQDLARLALHLLDRLQAEPPAEALLASLAVRAWTLLGHARALAYAPPASVDEAFATASRLLPSQLASDDEAELCERMARAMHLQGRPSEALALGRRAADLYAELGETGREIGALELLARVAIESGDLERALGPLAGALLLADAPDGPPRSLAGHAGRLRHRLAWTLVVLQRYREAAEVLAAAPVGAGSAGQGSGPYLLLATQLGACAGDLAAAEDHLRSTLHAGLDRGCVLPAMLAAVSLAAIYRSLDRPAELARLASHLARAESAGELAPESRHALGRLRQAIENGQVTLTLLVLTAESLRVADQAGLACVPGGGLTH
jgi:hypothetical protein